MICLDIPASHFSAFVREHEVLCPPFPSFSFLSVCPLPSQHLIYLFFFSAHPSLYSVLFFSSLCVTLFFFLFSFCNFLSLLAALQLLIIDEKNCLGFEFIFTLGISFPRPSLRSRVICVFRSRH